MVHTTTRLTFMRGTSWGVKKEAKLYWFRAGRRAGEGTKATMKLSLMVCGCVQLFQRSALRLMERLMPRLIFPFSALLCIFYTMSVYGPSVSCKPGRLQLERKLSPTEIDRCLRWFMPLVYRYFSKWIFLTSLSKVNLFSLDGMAEGSWKWKEKSENRW